MINLTLENYGNNISVLSVCSCKGMVSCMAQPPKEHRDDAKLFWTIYQLCSVSVRKNLMTKEN